MGDLDAQTCVWLHSLKLGKTLNSVSDFQNGYHFGSIFQRLNISRGRKFKNSSDLACIFQNYKNTKDLLRENFGVQFPVSNIIYQTGPLLIALRDQCIQYVDRKKQAKMQSITSLNMSAKEERVFSKRQRDIKQRGSTNPKMPKKIQDIEKKLEKFREHKTTHELLALKEQKKEMEYKKQCVQENRQNELNKVRNNHEFTIVQKNRVEQFCSKVDDVKRLRIEKDRQFKQFQKNKIDRHYSTLREEEVKSLQQGIEQFQTNCVRQGIDLFHDPDKPNKPDTETFNKTAVMERIKGNIEEQQKAKKDRLKRENKKKIDANQAKLKSQAVLLENGKLQKYQHKMKSHLQMLETIHKQQLREQSQKALVKSKCKGRKFVELSSIDNSGREEQMRQNRIIYLKKLVNILQYKQNRKRAYAQQVLDCLLQATIEFEDQFQEKKYFSLSEFKELEKYFLEYQTPTIEQSCKEMGQQPEANQFVLWEYVHQKGSWRNFSNLNLPKLEEFAAFIKQLIDSAYPPARLPQAKGDDIPLQMPLRLMMGGNRLSGKTTQSQRIAQKFKCTIIDPLQTIKEAIELCRKPIEDNKKKKDSKKEELSEQKIALKQLGETMQDISSADQAKPNHLIAAIKFLLKQNFRCLSEQQKVEKYEAAKIAEEERYAQALKAYQQASKKPKKDAKKGGLQVTETPPSRNPYFYSNGFILENCPFTADFLRLLEIQLNSFMPPAQRINQQAENLKSQFSQLLPIVPTPPDRNLHNGLFDIVLQLNAKLEQRQQRNQGRKVDLLTGIVYHPKFNPAPQTKGFADKLVSLELVELNEKDFNEVRSYYSCFGDNKRGRKAYTVIQCQESIEETFKAIVTVIENTLQGKYQELEQKKRLMELEKAKYEEQNNEERIDRGQKLGEDNQNKRQLKDSEELKRKQENQENQKNQSQNNEEEKQKKTQQDKQQQKLIRLNQAQKQQKKQDNNSNRRLVELSIQQIVNTLPAGCQKSLLDECMHIMDTYKKQLRYNLSCYDNRRDTYWKELTNIQEDFMRVINRPDDKGVRILSFQESYNKLYAEQSNILKDREASGHLVAKLDVLYDSLWDSLQAKKNEAVAVRHSFMRSDFLQTHTTVLVEVSRQILQTELNYLTALIFYLLGVNSVAQGGIFQLITDTITLGIPPEYEHIDSTDAELMKSKRMSYYMKQTQKCLQGLAEWVDRKAKKLKKKIRPMTARLIECVIEKQSDNIRQIVDLMGRKTIECALEYRVYYNALLNKMDDWIILGIKAENQFVYRLYGQIKNSILNAQRSLVHDLQVRDISSQYRILTKQPKLPCTVQCRGIALYSWMIFFTELRCLCSGDKILFETFTVYFDKRKKSRLLDEQYLNLHYDTAQQYLVSDGFLVFRELALAMLLWNVNVLDDDGLIAYRAVLAGLPLPLNKDSSKCFGNSSRQRGSNNQSQRSSEEEIKIKQSQANELIKDNVNQKPDQQDQHIQREQLQQRQQVEQRQQSHYNQLPPQSLIANQRQQLRYKQFTILECLQQSEYYFKPLLFEIFRNQQGTIKISEYIDVLRRFTQFQILRFGDAVMINQL